MATSMTGPALYLTEIKVTDWPGTVRWYVSILGMRLSREDAPHEYALLESGTGGGRVALKGGRAARVAPSSVRLVFESADVDALRALLASRGEEVSPPEDSPEGYRAIRLCDPEGTPITVFCWR
jgi:predicted enzyme related to lactoylglutathione lyase